MSNSLRVDRADREWRRYLIATVRDFAIWGSPPAGRIDIDKTAWLVATLRTSSRKTAGAITREIMREAPEADDETLQALSVNPMARSRRAGVSGLIVRLCGCKAAKCIDTLGQSREA